MGPRSAFFPCPIINSIYHDPALMSMYDPEFYYLPGWYYDDVYQQQRKGVKIDSIMSPTIEGNRQKRDEILLTALDCPTGVEQIAKEVPKLLLYPNTVEGNTVHARLHTDSPSEAIILLIDISGHLLLDNEYSGMLGHQSFDIDLSHLCPLEYICFSLYMKTNRTTGNY